MAGPRFKYIHTYIKVEGGCEEKKQPKERRREGSDGKKYKIFCGLFYMQNTNPYMILYMIWHENRKGTIVKRVRTSDGGGIAKDGKGVEMNRVQ